MDRLSSCNLILCDGNSLDSCYNLSWVSLPLTTPLYTAFLSFVCSVSSSQPFSLSFWKHQEADLGNCSLEAVLPQPRLTEVIDLLTGHERKGRVSTWDSEWDVGGEGSNHLQKKHCCLPYGFNFIDVGKSVQPCVRII